ncbi:hypothetical protein SLS62_001854 [Diatrype stigma]|uniref:Calcineurin-like phosphoesterase domain-containing protein n=1 Tax=Diatrype stigma TaxID=117547 RepID=A0AAN9YRH2_9PEZI
MFGSQQRSNTSGLEALLHRPRPTAWQQFLRRPCVYLARELYNRRQQSSAVLPLAPPPSLPPQAGSDPVSVVCISDTHNTQPALPDGDILIHAGDLTQSGTFQELEVAIAWLRRQPHPIKIVVAGNHDLLLDADRDNHNGVASAGDDVDAAALRRSLDWGDIIYLEDEETTVTVTCNNNNNSNSNGQRRLRHLRVYGSPRTPRHGSWAFQYPRETDVWASEKHAVPGGVDVLVTHGPPQGHLDAAAGLGCAHLLGALWGARPRPRLHVFGHVHEGGAGVEALRFDGLQAAYERTVAAGGGVWNLVRTAAHFVLALLGPAVEAQSLLVNAAMVGGLRDEERRVPVKVFI